MFFAGIRIALRSLRRNVLRTFLTILGILIGVASVVFVTTLVDGARAAISNELRSVGPNVMFIFPQSTMAAGTRKRLARLNEEDARAIAREATSISKVATAIYSRSLVVFRDNNVSTTTVGVNLAYFDVHSWTIGEGTLWTEKEEAVGARVCVLGTTTRENLFGSGEAVGQTIRVGRYPYLVVGVLGSKGSSFGNDNDDQILTPIAGARARLARGAPGYVSGISVLATSTDTVDRAIEQVTGILRQRHKIAPNAESDFDVRSMRDLQRLEEAIYAILTALLVTIAGISLLVGGIGVMNIMLVSVAERTREIGIRMAIGARARDVQTQFLVEAVVLALLGGVAGILSGTLLAETVGIFLQWKMHPSAVVVVISVSVSGLIGIGFGYLPARRAAALDPMTALRYE